MNKDKIIIDGVRINLSNKEVLKCKTPEDVDKLEIFKGFNEGAKKRATQKLLDKLNELKKEAEEQLEKMNGEVEKFGNSENNEEN